jgi:hypothetical protein
LTLHAIVDGKLIGRVATLLLMVGDAEIELGSVAVEREGEAGGRIRFAASLRSVGLEVPDGALPSKAFSIVIGTSPTQPMDSMRNDTKGMGQQAQRLDDV